MELCPLPEEFEAILGSRLGFACQIVVPLVQTPDLHSIQYQMARMFNIPPQSSFQHILGNGIAMSSILEAIMAMDNIKVYWLSAFMLNSCYCHLPATVTLRC